MLTHLDGLRFHGVALLHLFDLRLKLRDARLRRRRRLLQRGRVLRRLLLAACTGQPVVQSDSHAAKASLVRSWHPSTIGVPRLLADFHHY